MEFRGGSQDPEAGKTVSSFLRLVNALSPDEKLHGEQTVLLPLEILRGQITREGLSSEETGP